MRILWGVVEERRGTLNRLVHITNVSMDCFVLYEKIPENVCQPWSEINLVS